MPAPTKKRLNLCVEPAEKRFGTGLTLMYIAGCLSRSEEKWLRELIGDNWASKPKANDEGYGE